MVVVVDEAKVLPLKGFFGNGVWSAGLKMLLVNENGAGCFVAAAKDGAFSLVRVLVSETEEPKTGFDAGGLVMACDFTSNVRGLLTFAPKMGFAFSSAGAAGRSKENLPAGANGIALCVGAEDDDFD